MNTGYVYLWRKALDSELYSYGLRVIGLFNWLLLKVCHEPRHFRGQELQPGEYLTTIQELSHTHGESPKAIRNIISKLEKCGAIRANGRANRYTVLSICNWGTYQVDQSAKGQTSGQTKGKPRANQGQRHKNVKNVRSIDTNVSSCVSSLIDLWKEEFPKKVQPRPATISKKVATRLQKSKTWGADAAKAIKHARSIGDVWDTSDRGWFQLDWLCKNDEHVSRVISGKYDWFAEAASTESDLDPELAALITR